MENSLQAQIEDYHRQLNRPAIMPRHAYRRNGLYFPLVTWVNHIVALYLSENFEPIPIFIRRAFKCLIEHQSNHHERGIIEQDHAAEYRELVHSYLRVMSVFIESRDCATEGMKMLIPEELRSSRYKR